MHTWDMLLLWCVSGKSSKQVAHVQHMLNMHVGGVTGHLYSSCVYFSLVIRTSKSTYRLQYIAHSATYVPGLRFIRFDW